MFVDLTKTKLNARITISKSLRDGDSVTFDSLNKTFTFKNVATSETDVAIAKTTPVNAKGSIEPFKNNLVKENDYININNLFGVFFSSYGAFEALYLKNNVSISDYFKILVKGVEYTFTIGLGNSTSYNVFINKGNTRAESAYYISKAITETLSSLGIMALNYGEVVVIVNLTESNHSSKNATSKITFNDKANNSDYFSFEYNNIQYRYLFGNGNIETGSTSFDSCINLAKAINEDARKPATAIAVGNELFLYSNKFGYEGNTETISHSSSFESTNFSNGSNSELEITDVSYSFGIQKITSCCSVTNNKIATACCCSSIHSLSSYFNTSFNTVNFTSAIEYSEEGVNMPMIYYGRALRIEGITKATKSSVDVIETANNFSEKLEQFGISCYTDNNVIHLEFDNKETITSSDESIVIDNYSEGTLDNPMSWIELISYKETLDSYKNNANLEITLIKGSFLDINEKLVLDSYVSSVLKINTFEQPIKYGDDFPVVLNNCDTTKVTISGRFISENNSAIDSGLVKIKDCTMTSCEIFNCENTQVNNESFLVQMYNCSMESSLMISNSTFTKSDNSSNSNLLSVSGYVLVKSSYNVFEGNDRASNNVFYLGSNCSLDSSFDCYSKINPTNSNSVVFHNSLGTNPSEPDCDEDLVIDKNNSHVWSLNLTSKSRALLISDEKLNTLDIYGNKRYLEKDLCKIIITVNDSVIENERFFNSNYIEIDGVRKFFGSDMPSSYHTKAEFSNAVRNAFISSKYKLGISNNGSVITLYGTNDTFNSNLGSYLSVDYEYEPNGVDAGSRQKHTIVNKEYNVDLSIYESTEDYLTMDDMESIIMSSFPCYGSITLNLKNSNSHPKEIKLGCNDNNVPFYGYCDFKFAGSKKGKNYVPTLRADLTFGSKQFLTFSFDGLIYIGKLKEIENDNDKEKTLIDVIFVNSVLKLSQAEVTTLRIIESTVVWNESSYDIVSVSKEFIVSGCIIKCLLNNSSANIKALFRYNYVVNEYEPELISSSKDETGTIYGSDCLVNSGGTSIEDFAIIDDSEALSHVKQISDLYDLYASETDILGNYRCYESVKESLDCGAYETNITYGKASNFVVNLSSDDTNNGGVYAPCSLAEVYEKINSMDKIDAPIYIELYGYGTDFPRLEISKEFTDSGSINFIGNPNAVLDGSIEDDLFVFNSENATVSFANVMLRNCSIKGSFKKLVLSSCAVVNSEEQTLITCDAECYFYGCSLQSKSNKICSSDSYVIGCSSQASVSIDMFDNLLISRGNVYYNGIIDGGLSADTSIMQDAIETDVIDTELFKLTESSVSGLVTVNDFDDLYEDAKNYNYNEDIRGFSRFEENENTDSGCYDSLGVTDASSYKDKPNGQYAVITKEGSSLITRMLTGKLKFKIVGYGLGKGGYSKKNPINSIPIKEIGEKTKYLISIDSNYLSDSDGISIGNEYIRATIEFQVKETISETVDSLIEYINKNNSCFYAEKVNDNSLILTALTTGNVFNGIVSKIGSNIEVEQQVIGTNANYGIDLFYPNDGYKEFEFVDHIPFAISFFMRIDRKQFQAALGEVIIYAKIIESEIQSEQNSLVQFAVVRHGILTKDKDSVIVRRIIIQV